MNKEQLKRIFEFIEEKEGQTHKSKGSLRWKLFFNEQLTKEELNVKGNFYLKGTKIESLPKGLEVEHDLYLNGSPITSLPKGLKVGGKLYTGYAPLSEYSDNELREMVKPGFIKGKIYR